MANEKATIKPGLHHLNLNLMHTVDPERVENRKMALETTKTQEHTEVHMVVDLMRVLLDNNLPKRKHLSDNIKKIEANIIHNPKHLNSLADLALMYRLSHSVEKADKCDEKIYQTLNSNDVSDMREKALCLLEQGYALLFEEYTDNEVEAERKLQDTCRLLSAEIQTATGERRERLKQSLNNTVYSRRKLASRKKFEMERLGSLYDKKKRCVEMLSIGIEMLRGIPEFTSEIIVWKYYKAMGCNRLCETLRRILNREESENYRDKMINNIFESVVLFWKVTHNLSDDSELNKRYRARSLAYIFHIFTAKKEHTASVLQLIKSEGLSHLLSRPKVLCQQAMELFPEDEVVLNHCGTGLYLLCLNIKEEDEKFRCLKDIEKVLNKSIILNQRVYLLAFSTRMNVYYEISRLRCVNNEERKDYLCKARDDGIKAVELYSALKDICKLATISQALEKFPNYYLFGPENVNENKYLSEALDYLNQGIRVEGVNYFLAFSMSQVLFDLGQNQLAIEWAKISFFLAESRLCGNSVRNICIFMLSEGQFEDLIVVLTIVMQKLKKISFVREAFSECIRKKYSDKLLNLATRLKTLPLTKDQVQIAECLRNLLANKIPKWKDTKQVLDDPYVHAEEVQLEYESSVMQSLLPDSPESCEPDLEELHDYVIINGKLDVGWVQCVLRQTLEEQLYDNDECFKGWWVTVDYNSSSSIIQHTIKAMEKGRSIIIMLSASFLTREWPLLKPYIVRGIEEKRRHFIVILLSECDIPRELAGLEYLDFRDHKELPSELQILKQILLSA